MLSTWRPGWASLVHRMQSSRTLTPLRSRRQDMLSGDHNGFVTGLHFCRCFPSLLKFITGGRFRRVVLIWPPAGALCNLVGNSTFPAFSLMFIPRLFWQHIRLSLPPSIPRSLLSVYHSINICQPYLIHTYLYLYLYCALSLSLSTHVRRGIIFALDGAGIVYGSLPCAAGSVRATTMQAVHAAWLGRSLACENMAARFCPCASLAKPLALCPGVCVSARACVKRERAPPSHATPRTWPQVPMPLERHVFVYTKICSSMQ